MWRKTMRSKTKKKNKKANLNRLKSIIEAKTTINLAIKKITTIPTKRPFKEFCKIKIRKIVKSKLIILIWSNKIMVNESLISNRRMCTINSGLISRKPILKRNKTNPKKIINFSETLITAATMKYIKTIKTGSWSKRICSRPF